MDSCPRLQRGLYEPVLAGHAEDSSPVVLPSECCRRAPRWVRLSLSDWWADSTTEGYLGSVLSRRSFMHISLAVVEALNLVTDSLEGSAGVFVIIDFVLLISVVLVTTLMPRQNLKADSALSSVMVLCSLSGLLAARCGHNYPRSSDETASQFLWAYNMLANLLFAMCSGMHSSTTLAAFLTLLLISTVFAPNTVMVWAAGACLAATLGVVSESLLAAAHKYHAALKTVLDCCSDGIVCVSMPEGIIRSASGKMQDIWWEGTVSGASDMDFKECLHPDDAGQWEALLEEAKTSVPKARLVTCQAVLLDSVKTADCKLVPYMRRHGELWLCCHIVGETRSAPNPGFPAFGAGQGLLASVEEEADQDPYSVVVQREEEDADEDPSSVVGQRDHVAPDALSPREAHSVSLHARIGAPSFTVGSELTYSISETSVPNPKVKVDASTQTSSSNWQPRPRPPRLPREPAQPPEAGAASSSMDVQVEGRQLRVSKKKKVLPQYEETPPSTLFLLLMHACCSINARSRGCCSWHMTIERMQTVLGKMRNGECQTNFLPYSDWQCAHCLALIACSEDADDDNECGICGGSHAGSEHNDTDSGELGSNEGAHRVSMPSSFSA